MAYFSLTAHNAGPERALSVAELYRQTNNPVYLKKHCRPTRMLIAINGVETAFFDTIAAVAKFLKKEEETFRVHGTRNIIKTMNFLKSFCQS